tara:strand:- start:919 stop:2406 length:1488 start_codon:yes stop_codon:yes gene_type:complete
MILGTSSGAGKSLLTAAICRVLVRAGQQPLPFKGQNMSNNAWIDPSGGEMAYSQALQSWAAKLEPISAMNPVLLKPKGNETSEVIHLGKKVGTSKAALYYEEWIEPGWSAIQKGLSELKRLYKNGRFILEGAGSPVEVNLKHRDLTNLRLANYLNANCILVADIERGGVFAQIIGTLSLLTKKERNLIKGIIVNRFRGNISLFDSGKDWIEKETGIPVLGIMPWLNEIFPAEDSMDLLERKTSKPFSEIEISVIKLPSISNFTDLDPLEGEPSVKLNWVGANDSIGSPDALIIPGSKQTIKDLVQLDKSGLTKQIKEYAGKGGIIFGICGGMQMLGEDLIDPLQLENSEQENSDAHSKGLNLLPISTIYENKKILLQRKVKSSWPKVSELRGFELHHGKSNLNQTSQDLQPITSDPSLGWVLEKKGKGNIAGSYLHGIFENGSWRRSWLNIIRKKKGLRELDIININHHEQREKIIDNLANEFINNINIDPIIKY